MKQDVYDTTATAKRPRSGAKAGSNASEQNPEEMMKRVEAAGKPGPGHKALENFEGKWKVEVKCWMDPGSEPNRSQGTAQARWILNGKFLEEDFHGEMMGNPFHGRTTLGYDNTSKSFKCVWIDDLNTSMFQCAGKGGDTNFKTITLEGKSSCAASKQSDIPMRLVYRIQSRDKHTLEMFDLSKNDLRTMEITYSRQS